MNELKQLEEFYIFVDQNKDKEKIVEFFNEKDLTKIDLNATIQTTIEIASEQITDDDIVRIKDMIKFLYSTYKSGYINNDYILEDIE